MIVRQDPCFAQATVSAKLDLVCHPSPWTDAATSIIARRTTKLIVDTATTQMSRTSNNQFIHDHQTCTYHPFPFPEAFFLS